MNIARLTPQPTHRVTFKRSHERLVPDMPGCYVLTTFSGEVLYVGLADNLRRRMDQHLDNPEKSETTKLGRAVFFHWVTTDDTFKVERTWMNIHIQYEGALPLLNKMFSPTAT